MSKNFLRVKRDILRDMKETGHHTQESWAKIMLEHTRYLKTDEDQEAFWNFILNPSDDREYKAPQFCKYDSEDATVPKFQTLTVKNVGDCDEKMEDVEITLENEEFRNGLTSYIKVTQVE